ncbi:hypothetical protein JBL43_16575 [Aureibaculum sp. A20]|uniref:Uncharacterized protein n=1 Tax=Aureibaculum flavum TaxID=2795986 RepID=A0ABS0WV58_9FLAO|nr:hypothetical protein [Aureibaculum flavum]MBJ2175871.1 hypothetical protein [Aureibaculum flavum]
MTIFKRILNYLIWTIVCLLAGFTHMRIVLGPKPPPSKGIMKMFDWVYATALIQVGAIVGGIIAVLYILFDIFYLRKKLMQSKNKVLKRLLVIIVIAITVGSTHYILEKVVNVI